MSITCSSNVDCPSGLPGADIMLQLRHNVFFHRPEGKTHFSASFTTASRTTSLEGNNPNSHLSATAPTRTKIHTATTRSNSQFAFAPSFTSRKQPRMINSTESNLFVLVPTIKVLGQECSENPQDERPIHEHSIPEVHRATFTLQELDYVKTISSQASSIVS